MKIRNLKRVPSDKHLDGYTFTFEALVGNEWIAYGPNVYGNWTCRAGLDRLPTDEWARPKWYKDTVDVGWTRLNEIFLTTKPKEL